MWITNAYQATTIWTDKAYVSDSYMEPCEFAKYLVEGYDSQLYAAMFSGDRDRILQLLVQVTDLLARGQCDCALPNTKFVNRRIILSLSVAMGLLRSLDDLTVVASPPRSSAATVQVAGSILAGVSACPVCAFEDLWQSVAASLTHSMLSVPAGSPYAPAVSVTPWVQPFNDDQFFSDVQQTLNHLQGCSCSHLTQLQAMQKALLLLQSAAVLPYEPTLKVESATGVLATVSVAGLSDSTETKQGGITVTVPTSTALLNAQLYSGGVTQSNFDLVGSIQTPTGVTTSITTYPTSWTDCRAGLLPLGTTFASPLFELDFSYGGADMQPGRISFSAPVDAQCIPDGTIDPTCGEMSICRCSFLNETTNQFSEDGCQTLGIEYGPSKTTPTGEVIQGQPFLLCTCNHTTEFTILRSEQTTEATS
jgi:hypothetical protein